MATAGRTFAELKDAICRDVQAMKDPGALMILLTYGVPVLAAMRVCIEADIFRYLTDALKPTSVEELTSNALRLLHSPAADRGSTNCAPDQIEFMTRMISAVCACRLIDEVEPGVYLANDMTKIFADEGCENGFKLIYDNSMGPRSTMGSMLDWVKKSEYRAPAVASEGPFQEARDITGTTAFQHWVNNDPASMTNLSSLMRRVQKDRLGWCTWFPVDELFKDTSAPGGDAGDSVFLVDVGGNLGHDLSVLAAQYPERKLRLVLQDMASVVEEAKKEGLDSRIEFSVHNFFQAQPIQSASIYFMHKILHDWPDSDCIQILQHLRDSLGPRSRIFINDVVVPDKGASLTLAAFDLTMLMQVCGKERTESMWRNLIEQVGGLTISKIWMSPKMQGEDIIEIVKAN